MDKIEEGDIVRVPQKVVLYSYNDDGSLKGYWSCPKPLAGIYLGEEIINGQDNMKKLLIDNELWYALPEDIQQWREHASQTNRSV